MTTFRTLDDADVDGRRVLVRLDLNVPVENGRVSDGTRIERAAGTLRELAARGAKVIVLSHFGRPKGRDASQSLAPVAAAVADVLGTPVGFAADCVGPEAVAAVASLEAGRVLVLENTRFHAGEEKNDPAFARALAELGDLWVADAFSVAHRAHASTEGLGRHLPAIAGRAMQAELDALSRALERPERPLIAVVGGAKVSTKLDLLANLVSKVDALVIGGGMANTFLLARGHAIGKSLAEPDLVATAREVEVRAREARCEIVLPVDVVVAREFRANAPSRVAALDDVAADEMILDIGPRSVEHVVSKLATAKTLVWNGPFGAFELEPFDTGTVAVAEAAAELTAAGKLASIAGGGDTVAALNRAGAADRFTYVSTAGGAFLEWLEGKALPGVEILRKQ